MNRKQQQIEICKALLNPDSRVHYDFINDNEIAVTINGTNCFVFHKKECVFDVSKMIQSAFIKEHFCEDISDVEIKQTETMFFRNGRMIKKYKGSYFNIYIDSKISKPFEGFRFFANSSLSRVLVKDDFDMIVGLFLPIKFKEETEAETNGNN